MTIRATATLQTKIEVTLMTACDVVFVLSIPCLSTDSAFSEGVCGDKSCSFTVALNYLACFEFLDSMLLVALQKVFLVVIRIFSTHTAILVF